MSDNVHPFEVLSPSFLLDAVESKGYLSDGRFLALNSYENRVYQVGIEESQPLIAKFYRPERWSDAQIQEEHDFCFELEAQELPVVAPLKDDSGASLFGYQGMRFALFVRRGGHAPELSNPDHLLHLGRMLGRIHRIGASKAYQHRPALNAQSFGHDSVALVSERFIPAELKPAYDSLARDLLERIDNRLAEYGTPELIRVHGDCHGGNILWRDEQVNFVDMDDSRMAPAIQDIWMLLSGDRQEQTLQLSEIVDGYNEFHDFNPRELHLVEVLRTLRMLHYSAWLARRWDDPAFPMAFPWFNSVRYWSNHILELREQLAALDEPCLKLM